MANLLLWALLSIFPLVFWKLPLVTWGHLCSAVSGCSTEPTTDVSKLPLNSTAQLSAAVRLDKGRQKTWELVCDEPCAALTLLHLFLTARECCNRSNSRKNLCSFIWTLMSIQVISETCWCFWYAISKSFCHHCKKVKTLIISCLGCYEVRRL